MPGDFGRPRPARASRASARTVAGPGPGPRCGHVRDFGRASGGWPEAAECIDCRSRGPGWILGHCSAHAAGLTWLHFPLHKQQSRAGQSSGTATRMHYHLAWSRDPPDKCTEESAGSAQLVDAKCDKEISCVPMRLVDCPKGRTTPVHKPVTTTLHRERGGPRSAGENEPNRRARRPMHEGLAIRRERAEAAVPRALC